MQLPEKKWVGYVVLAAGLLMIAHARHLISVGDYPEWAMPVSLFCELYGGYLLVVLGIFAILSKRLASFVRNFAAGETLHVTNKLEHESTEEKRKERLPLQQKRSALADRGVVGGAVLLLLLIPAFMMLNWMHPEPRGIYVRVPSLTQNRPSTTNDGAIVVTLLRAPGKPRPRVLLNGEEISHEELPLDLKGVLAKRADWTVFVEADDNLAYTQVIDVVDVVNKLGGHSVLLTPKMREEVAKNN